MKITKLLRPIRRAFRNWLDCRLQRCDYYRHYLAYGPAELTHIGFHSAERLARQHFDNCRLQETRVCNTCTRWEQRLRA